LQNGIKEDADQNLPTFFSKLVSNHMTIEDDGRRLDFLNCGILGCSEFDAKVMKELEVHIEVKQH
jgi:hypothetical protein